MWWRICRTGHSHAAPAPSIAVVIGVTDGLPLSLWQAGGQGGQVPPCGGPGAGARARGRGPAAGAPKPPIAMARIRARGLPRPPAIPSGRAGAGGATSRRYARA